MIKYQLERIKDMYSGISDPDRLDGIPVVTVSQSDIEWLIEQAERVQELEDTVKHAMKAIDNTEAVRVKLINAEQQNKRYKQALEFYADEEHYKEKLISEAQYDADGICISNDEYAPPIIYFDSGETARKALEGEK